MAKRVADTVRSIPFKPEQSLCDSGHGWNTL